jgi:hypothetical protein
VIPLIINEQVKRKASSFPEYFIFQLNESEFEILKSKIATSNKKQGDAICDTLK